jgi:hypothetical protein
MQYQALRDIVAGVGSSITPQQFDDDLASVAFTLMNTSQGTAQEVLSKMLGGLKNGQAIMQAIAGCTPGNCQLHFQSLAQIGPTLPPIKWLWQDWIPRGMLSLCGAMKGAGKSYWMLDIARRIIHDETWPDETPVDLPDAKVIYVDAELIPQLIYQRAQQWEMNSNNLYLMQEPGWGVIDFVGQQSRDRLIEMCYSIKPQLVILDSLGSLNSKGEDKKEDVQELLKFFTQLAFEFQIGVVMVHHLRKKNPLAFADIITLDDFRGSGHIVQMSRTVIGISVIQTSKERNPNGPRRVDMIATNLTAYPDPIGFNFEPGVNGGPVIVYGDAPQQYHEPTERERAEDFILDALASGPCSPDEIIESGARKGYSRATIYRAHDNLERAGKVGDTTGNKSPDNQWKLEKA